MTDEPIKIAESKRYVGIGVPRNLGELAEELCHNLAAELGESPEAWRGAHDFAAIIKTGITMEVVASIEATGAEVGDVELPELLMIFMVLIGLLEQLPMWPKEDEDAPS